MRFYVFLVALATLPVIPASASQSSLPALRGVKKVLFLGDSITYAGGYIEELDAYLVRHFPSTHIELINVGLPSENISGLTEPNHAGGAFPRPDLHERLDRALAATKPDMVVACYGMNDGIYYPYSDDRFRKYSEGIRWLRAKVTNSKARLWLLTPPPFDPQPVRADLWPAGRSEYPSGHTFEGYDDVLGKYSAWLLSQRANGWHVIDIHNPLNTYLTDRRKADPKFAFASDGVHLNEVGHTLIAREILRAWGAPEIGLPFVEDALHGQENSITGEFQKLIHHRQRIRTDAWLTSIGHKRPGMATGLPLIEAAEQDKTLSIEIDFILPTLPPQFPGQRSDYHSFVRHDFEVDGVSATVVSPYSINPTWNLPWIWRAEFFDHRPELDLALLKKGFHLVYINVGNTFGAPSAMRHWDALYSLLTKTYGLSHKPVLEGLSRGGLYIYNWAVKHPYNVGVLYGDNPVCDFKSWPGGKGKGPGSADDWKELINDYGFHSEAEAIAFKGNPIDNLGPLAKAHVPIIHCAADADEVVPYEENTVILKKRYEEMGGEIQVIVKHGFKHHPHGLDDPTPLVDFIFAHLRKSSRREFRISK